MSLSSPVVLFAALAAAAVPAAPESPPSLRRFALLAGSNRGPAERPALRYAVRDAERVGRVLTAMGGVAPADAVLLKEPTHAAFEAALKDLGAKAAAARRGAARVEVLVYFSGHADERGLMLGSEQYAYKDLRASIRSMSADVGIAVLDACASGAITRLKSGSAHPAFLSDATMDVQGYAFLASSSEGEAAQESDRLGGSYFTQALLTGLRGAADTSGDGRVTLGEAYQFAFNETLSQTTTSQAGAQHPSYDIKMAGTGDVVMTDVRKISASLILGADYDGRFYVLDAAGRLVAELHKPGGRAMELGLETGEYRVYYEQAEKLLSAPLKLGEGQRQELVRSGLRPARRLPTLIRGGALPLDALHGRTRAEFSGLLWGDEVEASFSGTRIADPVLVGSLLHWPRRTFALEVGFSDRGLIETRSGAGLATGGGSFVGSTRGVFVGGRYYPRVNGSLRPFALANVGLYDDVGIDADFPDDRGLGAGATVGGGGDLLLWNRWSVSAHGTVSSISGRGTFVDLRIGLGLHWGRPKP
jgi:uncharacterized caspase-like protein